MAEIKNEIVLNVLMHFKNADEATGAIGALITAGVLSMNDVIKTMYNQYIEEKSSYYRVISSYDVEMSYYNDEIAELNEEKAELTAKIAELENITVTDEDVEKEYGEMAENYKMELDKVKSLVAEDALRRDLQVEKAFDLVRESADVTEVTE